MAAASLKRHVRQAASYLAAAPLPVSPIALGAAVYAFAVLAMKPSNWSAGSPAMAAGLGRSAGAD